VDSGATFRTAKHLLVSRPIFHKLDETIRGYVFCSFLALVLKKALDDRIAALDRSGSWPQIIADLDSLNETEIEHDTSLCDRRPVPPPVSRSALPASPFRRPCAKPRTDRADPKCSAKPPLRR
jgi:hypothetical protein